MSVPARQPSLTPSLRSDAGAQAQAGPSAGPPAPARRPSALSAGASEARRARRDQLRDYYGLKGKEGEGGETGGGAARREGRSKDELDLESPNFNANTYYDSLISRSSLQELLKTAAQLKTDINALESARHTLVYNHHPQLFAAGDTISALNARTPQLLGIVTQLQERFSEMSRMADRASLDEVGPAHAGKGAGAGIEPDAELGVRRVAERIGLLEAAGEAARAYAEAKQASLLTAAERDVPGAQEAADRCAALSATAGTRE